MFFANLVLRHYETLHRRSARARGKEKLEGKPDFYISPRTQAKALDALRAIALMNRRTEVSMPVRKPIRPTERRSPVGPDRVDGARLQLESAHVFLQPLSGEVAPV